GHTLPENNTRESALVFIDISGFTKLSTMLDEETLSSVINSYFDMIVGEVNANGGDVLKFAGDALFAEWRVPKTNTTLDRSASSGSNSNALKGFNSSLSSMNTDDEVSTAPDLATAVLRASRCAAAIVQKYSDHDVTVPSRHVSGSLGLLNVHCGIGAGILTGIHTSDYQVDEGLGEEENAVESRREYLFLGDAIDQVSKAAHIATDGEVLISPRGLSYLAERCEVPSGMMDCLHSVCIASRESTFIDLVGTPEVTPRRDEEYPTHQNIRRHCRRMSLSSLSRLHSQVALYVHPVVRGEVWDSAATGDATIGAQNIQQRHQMEAELRTVFTMFIKALVTPTLTNHERDNALFAKLRIIMHVTSRELDRFSGQLRQFIVDDKGVVLIAVFGLRGSTFSDLVANNALPASFAIQSGLRRHEFAVMGAPVNLAARLMDSALNESVLVDENVRNQARGKVAFRSLPPIKAKGYDKPVVILEPVHLLSTRPARKIIPTKFVGREDEKMAIVGFAHAILNDPLNPQASIVNIVGDSGIGKSALLASAMKDIKKACSARSKDLVVLRSTSTEDQQRIPLTAFRKVLLGAIRELCFHDGTMSSSSPEKIPLGFVSDEIASGTRPPQVAEHRASPAPRIENTASSTEKYSHRTFSRQESCVMRPDTRPGKARGRFPYLEKLVWACRETGYSEQLAHVIACQFLGLEDSSPLTQIDGAAPQMSTIVKCIAKCFVKIVDFADIVVINVDDFQWVDSLTWRVTRELSQSAKRMLILRASRSHDKRAMRRMSNGLSRGIHCKMEITLGPLNLDDIKELVSNILAIPDANHSVNEEVCTHIYQKTGGLPVYVIELLETMKRNKSFGFDTSGTLSLSLKDTENEQMGNALVLSQMLNRFDALEASVRKILHTCAVLGMSFSLSDVIRVHPEINLSLVQEALDVALSEMILAELGGEDDERSTGSRSSAAGGSNSKLGSSVGYSKTSSRLDLEGERNFEFSHEMWRTTVLATLLEARKVKLHRLIALAMEKEVTGDTPEQSDLSRLLTLFEHWKLCGDFSRAAPLALVVGERLNEWDLVHQCIDLCRDALDMSWRSVEPVEKPQDSDVGDWVQVSSNIEVLNLIIKLHLRIAENYRLVDRIQYCVKTYEDAYAILRGCSEKCPSLRVSVLVGLLSANLESTGSSEQMISGQESLFEEFLGAARDEANPIHLARALAMRAQYLAEHGHFEKALEDFKNLQSIYKSKEHSPVQCMQYGKDYVMDAFSQSVLWLFLVDKQDEAVQQGLFVLRNHLPLQNPRDVDRILSLLLPTVLVLKFVGRGEDAHFIFCKYVLNAYHDFGLSQVNCTEIFNPMIYLLEIVKMEECGHYDVSLLDAIQVWLFDTSNTYYSPEHLRLGHTLMGEICYRLGQVWQEDDLKRSLLLERARFLLTPIAREVHSESFLAHTALAFLRAMDRMRELNTVLT
ncbi:MAG: hypothetical protein SGILL_004251, partial [Bacillariaceae sp.]